jgi:hypothetical protein
VSSASWPSQNKRTLLYLLCLQHNSEPFIHCWAQQIPCYLSYSLDLAYERVVLKGLYIYTWSRGNRRLKCMYLRHIVIETCLHDLHDTLFTELTCLVRHRTFHSFLSSRIPTWQLDHVPCPKRHHTCSLYACTRFHCSKQRARGLHQFGVVRTVLLALQNLLKPQVHQA